VKKILFFTLASMKKSRFGKENGCLGRTIPVHWLPCH
jgi:hypothetical protein